MDDKPISQSHGNHNPSVQGDRDQADSTGYSNSEKANRTAQAREQREREQRDRDRDRDKDRDKGPESGKMKKSSI